MRVAATFLCLWCIPTIATARFRPGDEFWIVNTRSISCCVQTANLRDPDLRVYRFGQHNRFQAETLDNLYMHSGQDTDCVNVLYIHGNRMTSSEAIQRAQSVYAQIRKHLDPNIRVRWMLWSWPSDPKLGPLRDVRSKAPRADTQTLYAGWFLQRFPSTHRLQIIGYSFGGRIATGCLHTAAGGSIGGRQVEGPPLRGARIGVNLVAPALDQHWLGNGANHGMAVENIGQLVLFYNNRDRVLSLYSLISKYYDPVALGFAGIKHLGTRSDGLPIDVYSKNCSHAVGLFHDELKYYEPCCSAAPKIAESLVTANSATVHVHSLESLQMLPNGSDFDDL